jgi:hypothetical protein
MATRKCTSCTLLSAAEKRKCEHNDREEKRKQVKVKVESDEPCIFLTPHQAAIADAQEEQKAPGE